MRITRTLLIILLLAVTAAALFGIGSLMMAQSLNWRILGSMLSIGLFSMTAMGCAFVFEKGVSRVMMGLGLLISAAGVALYLWEIWTESLRSEELLISIAIWAVALPVYGHVALTRFKNLFWLVRLGTLLMIILMAVVLTVVVWSNGGDDFIARLIASGMILTLLGVIATPVLHKIAGDKIRPEPETTKLELNIECPRCRTRQTLPQGESRCVRCRLRFNIDVEEPRCPGCGYLLYQLTSPRCPECGREVAEADVIAAPPAAVMQGSTG